MNPIQVIVNPAAGGGRGAVRRGRLEDALLRRELDYRIHVSRSEAHLRQLARRFAASSGWLVIVGGDTSFRIAAAEILKHGGDAEKRPAMGFYAAGSANDIVRSLGCGDADGLCRMLASGVTRAMDVGRIRFVASGESRYFIGSLSLGLGVAVNREMAAAKGARGREVAGWLGGICAVRRAFRSPEVPVEIEIRTGDEVLRGAFTLAAFMNTPHYAGGLRPVPHASAFDGELDLVLVSTRGWWDTLVVAAGLALGRRRRLRAFRGRRFRLRGAVDFHVQLDGDVLFAGSECIVELVPGGLRVAARDGNREKTGKRPRVDRNEEE